MTDEHSFNHMDIKTNIGYAAGSICNDITASLMDSYGMLFYQNVLHIEKTDVGIIYLLGRLADGFASVLVGFLSDLNMDFRLCNAYGRRKVRQEIFQKVENNVPLNNFN